MSALCTRTLPSHPLGTCLLILSLAVANTAAPAQTVAPASARAAAIPVSARTTAAWTLKIKGDIRWQQVTPSGTLLISSDAALMGVDIERGQVAWEKPELGGLPADSVRMIEGSLLMEAARPGCRRVDSRQLSTADESS